MITTDGLAGASPRLGPVRAVAFDLDGLLIDSEPLFLEAARRLLGRRGLKLEMDVWQALMGTPAAQAIAVFCDGHRLPESRQEVAEEYRQALLALLAEGPVPLMPGAVDLLDRLARRSMPCCIATSSSRAYVDLVLTRHGLLPRFEFVLTCDDVREGKPHPEVYEKAAARFGVAPAELLVLEDSVNGLRAAKAAGAQCVVVPHALVARDQLDGADAVIESLTVLHF
jgi:HAD superfamily hydrolase (TIGR01509 family)